MSATVNFGLSKTKAEEPFGGVSVDALPRAVLRPTAYLLLDGEWNFALDSEDRGLTERWFLGRHYEETATWPGSVEEHMRLDHKEKSGKTDTVIVWYERDFPLPVWEDDSPKSMIQLTFGACGYETRVWLNGFPIRTIENESVHRGEYFSFTYELDRTILRPVNRLTVRISDSLSADIPRGKQESHIYKRGGIWYQTYSGPVRSVWLESIERNRLRSRIGVESVIEDRLVCFNLTVHIHDPGNYHIALEVYPRSQRTGPPLASDTFDIPLEPGEKQQGLVLHIPDANLWSVESPNLYTLVAKLIDSEGYTAVIESNFGLRKIEARGNKVYLNNHPVYLNGILYQPGTSSYEEIKRHLYAMKELGCNLVRIHISGLDPRIYKLADKLGMLLWVEVPSPHRSTRKSRKNHHHELFRMLNLLGSHPSIVIWSLYNEGWGAQDILTNAETRRYIIDVYNYIQVKYPQFLVIDNDGWYHVSNEGRLNCDLLTAHVYTPDLARWKLLLDKMEAGEFKEVTPQPLVVGDPFFYRGQVPLVVSEWGGFGFKDYGGPSDSEKKNELIRLFKAELRKRSIAGDVYTQATGIEDEQNGLIDQKSGELLAAPMVLHSSFDSSLKT